MSNVVVSGLPANVSRKLPSEITCSTIAHCFSNILSKIGVRKFWVRALSYHNGSKQASIEFVSHFEALNATNRLNNLLLDFDGCQFPLEAHKEVRRSSHSLTNYRRRSPILHRDWYNYERVPLVLGEDGRVQSRHLIERDDSPIRYQSETSKLDMEIELLRKQRLVIEEERRLLMATKKMELVREYGPSAAKELAFIDKRDRDSACEPDERWLPQRAEKRPFRTQHFRPQAIKRPHFTPLFVLPCKKLMRSMRGRMTDETTDFEAKVLWGQVRYTLRKRIAVALEGKPRMATADIVQMYRKLYPEKADDDLVKRLLNKFREESGRKEIKVETAGAAEDALSEPSTSTADLKRDPPSPRKPEGGEDTNEFALSLDATEIESLNGLNGEGQWSKDHGDWWSEDANQAFDE